jgi:hypothetical protein
MTGALINGGRRQDRSGHGDVQRGRADGEDPALRRLGDGMIVLGGA